MRPGMGCVLPPTAWAEAAARRSWANVPTSCTTPAEGWLGVAVALGAEGSLLGWGPALLSDPAVAPVGAGGEPLGW